MDVVKDERGSVHWCSVRTALSFSLSLLILSGIERKKKVNTQAAPALFNHFTPPALISLQHAAVIATDQNLIVFVLEAFLRLLP